MRTGMGGQVAIGLLAVFGVAIAPAMGGSLVPPGAPGPTMKTLDQVESRIPISVASLPLRVTSKGSYYLTGDVAWNSTNQYAIIITASNVTIDLNGYALVGPGKTQGTTGGGILASNTAGLVVVRNGTVSDWCEWGVRLDGNDSVVSDVSSAANGSGGIRVGTGGIVRNCVGSRNGSSDSITAAYGIYVSSRGLAENNTCNENIGTSGYGIYAGASCNVSKNVCNLNGGTTSWGAGINSGDHCLVADNVCDDNTAGGSGSNGAGIYSSGSYATFRGNSCYSNDGGDGGFGYGIYSQWDCLIEGNTCIYNGSLIGRTQCQIYAHGRCTVRNNYCKSSASGTRYGIWLQTQDAVVINNVVRGCLSGSIYVNSTCSGVLYGGNLMQNAIVNLGSGTTNAVVGGANIVF